jgi:hypothetical protein
MKKYVHILLLLALAAVSCEIPFKLDDVSDPAIYVQYLPCSGAQNGIKIGYASPAFGNADMSRRPLNVSDVTVTVDGVKASVEEINSEEAWNMHTLSLTGLPELKPGSEVALSVKGNGVPDVHSSTVIPRKPVLKSVELIEETVDTNSVLRVVVKLDKPVEEGEYYGIKAYVRSTTVTLQGKSMFDCQTDTTVIVSSFTPGKIASYADLNSLDLDNYTSVGYQNGFLDTGLFSGSAMTLLSQRQFDGDTYTFYANSFDSFDAFEGMFDLNGGEIPQTPPDFEWPEGEEGEGEGEGEGEEDPPTFYMVLSFDHEYRVEIYRLTDEFYNYAKAQYLSTFNMLSNFGVTPPNFTYSNISGGLGIVAGLSVVSSDWIPGPREEEE